MTEIAAIFLVLSCVYYIASQIHEDIYIKKTFAVPFIRNNFELSVNNVVTYILLLVRE